MKKFAMLSLGALLLFACGGDTMTSPTTSNPPPEAVQATAPVVAATPQAALPATPTSVAEVKFSDSGAFEVKNISSSTQTFYVYAYRVFEGGEQQAINGPLSGTVRPGDTFYGNVEIPSCMVQVDVSQVFTPNKISAGELFSKFINSGKYCTCELQESWKELEPVTTYSEWSEWTECSLNGGDDPSCTTQCSQSRSRTATTTVKEVSTCNRTRVKSEVSKKETETRPCEGTLTVRYETTYGKWSKKGYLGEECGQRDWVKTKYTLNSCTKKETSEVVDRGTESKICSVEPEVNLCHTENPKSCKWSYDWHKGWGWDCSPIHDEPAADENWGNPSYRLFQCQNKHVATTGHIPGHTDGVNHADYLGTCKMATQNAHSGQEICYNITGTPQ